MSVPVWEQGSAPRVQSRPRVFLGCVLALLLAMAPLANEIARNQTLFARTQPGQVQNVSIHYKTVRVAEVALFAAVPPEATSDVQPLIMKLKAGSYGLGLQHCS